MRERHFFGGHRLRDGSGFVVARLDVAQIVDAPASLCRDLVQRSADAFASRFYNRHVLDTPEGQHAQRLALVRKVGYTLETQSAATTSEAPHG